MGLPTEEALVQTWAEIVADVQRNWLIYGSMPFIAAFIGWGTKIVAIKMMFRPHKFKGIGRLGWQGIIPKRSTEMVDVLCETLTGRLISAREIVDRVDGVEVAALIERPLRAEVARIVNDVAPEHQAALWNLLPGVGRDVVIGQAQRAAPDVVVEIAEAISEHIDEVFDLQEMVTEEFLADPDTLESMFLDVGRREFAFIRHSGLFFGFCIGLVQVSVWALFLNPWVMPLFGLFTGWFTDWAALRLIFNPKEPKKYLGVVTWHGLFLKHRIPVSEEYGVLIANRVLTSDRLVRALFTGPRSDKVVDLVAEKIEDAVRREATDLDHLLRQQLGDTPLKQVGDVGIGGLSLGGLLGTVSSAASRPASEVAGVGFDLARVEPMCQAAAEELAQVLPVLLAESAGDYLTEALDIQATMSEKMVAMTPEEFEGVLRPAFQADEKTLIRVGAILGFLVGDLQVLAMEYLHQGPH